MEAILWWSACREGQGVGVFLVLPRGAIF
jgi:ribonuclease HI